MIVSKDPLQAIEFLRQGEVIAYPTEAVFGLGCDPFNESAVLNLLRLKQRKISKGLIVIASNWGQIESLIQPLTNAIRRKIAATWPGPVTWVFPASEKAPDWIIGNHQTIAIRVPNHPLARRLCEIFQKPIVSSSANLSGVSPARTVEEVIHYFGKTIPFILDGEVGGFSRPTPIRDVLSDKLLRE